MLRQSAFTLLFALAVSVLCGQQESLSGTFVNAGNTISVQFKPAAEGYHGLMQANGLSFAVSAQQRGQQFHGTIYSTEGNMDFTASWQSGALVMQAFGTVDYFYRWSTEHSLTGVDLTPYMYGSGSGQVTPPTQGDFDYSYSQSREHAGEQYTPYPAPANRAGSPYPALNDRELHNLVAGSQVVYYTRTSYLNDHTASSITYVNFCANGQFWVNYDGSFMVEGAYGDSAAGASYGQNSGTWQLVTYQDQPAVFLAYNNGNTSVNPLNKQRILEGRWRVGNTQYAVQRNKVRCH